MIHRSLPHLFEYSVQNFASNKFLWEKRDGAYQGVTYQQALDRMFDFAAGLKAIGLEKGDRVALISEGRNDWVIAELAILACGGVCVPLSVKIDAAADLEFRLQHAGCKGMVVSGNHSHKVFELWPRLEKMSFVVLLDPVQNGMAGATPPWGQLVDMKTLFEQGSAVKTGNGDFLHQLLDDLNPEDYANICYTSGTTADPKGIILTHGNYLRNVEQASSIFDVPSHYTSLHILPWDHSFAHTVGIYALIRNGASLASLKIGKTPAETIRSIPQCIQEIKPHFLLSVPALAKNFRGNIENGVRSKGALAWALFRFGLWVSYAYNREGHNKGQGMRRLLKPLVKAFDAILFKKIREGFGGRLEFFVGGGALLDIEVQRFFCAVGMPMYQGYGLTEASPIISSNTPDFHKMGSSGKVVPWLDLKICDDKGKELPMGSRGEIVVRGENIMAGYWDNENATLDALRDGWLHTGDLGYLDKDGYLFVLGRYKSLLIGSDGEKYSPEGIEEALMEKSAFFDQVLLYNNQNPYTVALIVVNKTALTGYVKKAGVDPFSVHGQEAILGRLRDEIVRYMPGGAEENLFPSRWLPASIGFLSESFSESNRLMNSTMKMVRPAIHTYHEERIAHLYTPEGKNLMNAPNKKAIESFFV